VGPVQSVKGVNGLRKIWIWVFFIGFSLFLLSSNFGQGQTWNPAEKLLIEMTAPFQKVINEAVHMVEGMWFGYFYLVDLRQEDLRLKKELEGLRLENSRYREILGGYDRMQSLLQFKEEIDEPAVAAQVIGRDPTGWFKSIIIDKGENAGVNLDMPVVNALGVVGRIVSVSPRYSKVLLVIDQNSAVDCVIQRSRDRGMVKGLSSEVCKLDYMVKSSDVVGGDTVVTSGLGGVFPKGLKVGQVLEVDELPGELFKNIRIKPAVDFSKLEEVLVILKEGISLSHLKGRE
jgi:rod shape-determining protein MreC